MVLEEVPKIWIAIALVTAIFHCTRRYHEHAEREYQKIFQQEWSCLKTP